MNGREFAALYGRKGIAAWEAAALQLAKEGGLAPWPYVDLKLEDGGDAAIVRVASDVLAIGTLEDHLRLPLLPGTAQSIANLDGSLLTTPLLEYRIWQQAPIKLAPTAMVPNQGASMEQYAAHSFVIDQAVTAVTAYEGGPLPGSLIAGQKKGVVVANFYKPGKVLLFGWYRPPPAPDVFDDGQPMVTPGRQPVQPKSNVHGDFYVDYSHGFRFVHPIAIVNGAPMLTEELYRHPTLSRLVSNDGPVKTVRYPAAVPPAQVKLPADQPISLSADQPPAAIDEVPRGVPTTPGIIDHALDVLATRQAEKKATT